MKSVSPLTPDLFIWHVLIPETTMCLIAEDLGLSRKDPKVLATLEASRRFGAAVFPIEDAKTIHGKSNDIKDPVTHTGCGSVSKSVLIKPTDQWVLGQLPALILPDIKSIYDPPAYGNCGFYAVAASINMYANDSYLDIWKRLKTELTLHKEDHGKLLSTPVKRPRMKTRNQPLYAVKVVQEIMSRLDHDGITCPKEHWMTMPTFGFLIASAFNRPVIHFHAVRSNCHTFFPYRTPPNKESPIVLAFVNENHFVSLGIGHRLVPFPEVYRQHQNSAMLDSTLVPQWIEAYHRELARWLN